MELLAKSKEVRLSIQDDTIASRDGIDNLQQKNPTLGDHLNAMEGKNSSLQQVFTLLFYESHVDTVLAGEFSNVGDFNDDSLDPIPFLNDCVAKFPFTNAVLNLDVFKIDQVIRNLVTNAVRCLLSCHNMKISHLIKWCVDIDEVYPSRRYRQCSHQLQSSSKLP